MVLDGRSICSGLTTFDCGDKARETDSKNGGKVRLFFREPFHKKKHPCLQYAARSTENRTAGRRNGEPPTSDVASAASGVGEAGVGVESTSVVADP